MRCQSYFLMSMVAFECSGYSGMFYMLMFESSYLGCRLNVDS